jgi:hypothetical protein
MIPGSRDLIAIPGLLPRLPGRDYHWSTWDLRAGEYVEEAAKALEPLLGVLAATGLAGSFTIAPAWAERSHGHRGFRLGNPSSPDSEAGDRLTLARTVIREEGIAAGIPVPALPNALIIWQDTAIWLLGPADVYPILS